MEKSTITKTNDATIKEKNEFIKDLGDEIYELKESLDAAAIANTKLQAEICRLGVELDKANVYIQGVQDALRGLWNKKSRTVGLEHQFYEAILNGGVM